METQLHNVFYKDDTFSLEYQILDSDTIVVHMHVTSFTHNTVKKWYREAVRLCKEASEKDFKQIITASPNPRFVQIS